MIKLALMCTDEASDARLQDCLRGEKDFTVNGSIVIQNIVHESERGLAFMNKMVKSQPDIAIIDQTLLRETAARSMPLVIEYMQKLSHTRTIIIGERFHEQDVIAMMKGTVRGFLTREQLDAGTFIKCIRLVAKGEVWLSGDLIGRVCDELVRECKKQRLLKSPTNDQLNKMKAISRREKEILALVSESMTNEEIAQKLFLSAKTVKTHVRNIFEKTDIRNRTEAALLFTRYRQEAVN
ncbi:MAG: helix-turn-helix transcriptional regulator [Smithellaceae bacterium]